jgi:pimeloyl-ACP methyl ester carboxylesterase
VFENGFGTGMSFWDEALLELSKTHSVFAYTRDDDLKMMKMEKEANSELITNILYELLQKCEVKAPYILVGHSLGGIYAQHFIRRYPENVVGLVLVDATYPNEFVDVESLNIPSKLYKRTKMMFKNIDKIGKALLGLPITKEIPTLVISATNKEDIKENPEYEDMIMFMHEKQKEYLTLYPHAKQIFVDTGHMVMFEKPKVVVDGIREVINSF